MDIKTRLKEMLISGLHLTGVSVADIDDDSPLFGEGLGLDSLDAVEVVVLVQREFHCEIKNMEEGKEAFASISALARFIEERTS
ncbi:phosphopantetheine-binding protein [Desulfovibrio inopinatus]|uniref:phosphopantetheine-binding protein n=1 Tax=Desulfovibrio inopinatus TaxID=102109 RepID=UPI000426366C|nr:phosphopantetheine-binding protein [Desulfovibrio inopinatus]